jgi:transcriptional regulator with XRE-family HTH domain
VSSTTHIGTEIRRVRLSLDMTLEEFGERVGIAWQTIAAYETGRATPPSDRLLRILHATRKAKEPFRVERIARALAAA